MEHVKHECLYCSESFNLVKVAVELGEQYLYFLSFDPELQENYSSIEVKEVIDYTEHLYSHQTHCGIESKSRPKTK